MSKANIFIERYNLLKDCPCLLQLPSASVVTINFTKSIARAAIYDGLNAVKTLFNNNELKTKQVCYSNCYFMECTIQNIYVSNKMMYTITYFFDFCIEKVHPPKDFQK